MATLFYFWFPSRFYFLALLAALCMINGCSATRSAEPLPTFPPTALRLEAPAQIGAGEPLTIIVHAEPSMATEPILLIAQGSFGAYPQRLQPEDGRVAFQLTPEQTRVAGTVTVIASTNTIERRATLEILPGVAVDPILPLVGPRSIVADGEHWTMAVISPRDKYLNPVADNHLVTLRVQHPVKPEDAPEKALEVFETHTHHLLAWKRIYSRTFAGESLLSASSGEAHSPERSFLEVPGKPAIFALTADRMILSADGRQLVRIRSEPIKDRYGNMLLDGSSVLLLAQMKDGEKRSLPAQIIDGRIDRNVQAPKAAGRMTLQAWIAGVSSRLLVIEFTPGPAIEMIPITVTITQSEVQLKIGPLIGALNQLIADGSEVAVQFRAADGTVSETTAVADYGYATVVLRRITLVPGRYQVAVQVGTGKGETTFEVP